MPKMFGESNFNAIMLRTVEYNICAPALLNLLNSLRKSDQMLGNPRILSLCPNHTLSLM